MENIKKLKIFITAKLRNPIRKTHVLKLVSITISVLSFGLWTKLYNFRKIEVACV